MVPVVAKSFEGHRRAEALLGSICGSRVGKAQLPSLTEIGSILNELLTLAGSGVQRQTPTGQFNLTDVAGLFANHKDRLISTFRIEVRAPCTRSCHVELTTRVHVFCKIQA